MPAFQREADPGQHDGTGEHWPLLRWLSLIGDRAGEVEVTVDRVDYVPAWAGGTAGDTSDLVDPAVADEAWLGWLAQQVGVRLTAAMTVAERRDAIAGASSGWRAGTKVAVAQAAQTVLTGTKYARVYDHARSVASRGSDSMWDVLVVTRGPETPDPATVLATIVAKRAKPAGVVLWHETYAASWATVHTKLPTWADWHTAGSWRNVEDTQA